LTLRVVADTNVIVSAVLWGGIPGKLIAAALEKEIELYASQALLDELADVIARKKLAKAVTRTGQTAEQILHDYRRLAHRVSSRALTAQVARDADDDQVLACALAARADLIISGDRDLSDLKEFKGMPIVRPAEAVRRIET
jgi:putative PIN family toxin of toxin-antitoxin system